MKRLPKLMEFDWDEGNIRENEKHGITDKEAEESFFDKQHKKFRDFLHSGKEERWRIVGKTNTGRMLFVVFTIRGERIRIISARDINKKEVYLYEKEASTPKV